MEKMTWVHPQTEVQQFVANEYVAACENGSGTKYLFVCDAHRAGEWVPQANVYDASGEFIGPFQACSDSHEADTTDDFYPGYIQSTFAVGLIGQAIFPKTPVMIWRGKDGNNIHCTLEINEENWTITNS